MEICYCGHPKERHNRKCKEERNRLETNYYFSACYHCVCKECAHNELLETHTVKEERVECHCGNGVNCPEECCAFCECATYEDGVHTKSTCNTPIDCPCHKEEVKEEPTTPEKELNLYCGKCGFIPKKRNDAEELKNHECKPATPEEKCCDDCKKYELGVNCQCVCHGVLPRHQGEKLPTSSYEVTCGLKPSPRERIQTIATELEHSIIRNGQFGRTVHSQAIELYLQEQYENSIKHSCGRV